MNSEQGCDLTAKGPAEDELVVKSITFLAIFSTLLEDVVRYFLILMTFSNFRAYNVSDQKFETLIDYK